MTGYRYDIEKRKVCGVDCQRTLRSLSTPARPAIHKPETNTYLIPLTKGLFAEVDAEDADLAQFHWCATTSNVSHTYYAYRGTGRINRKHTPELLHRRIYSRMLSRELTKTEIVDHKNRNGLDCRRSNLRFATSTQNMANQKLRSDSISGFKGVGYDKRKDKWRARIKHSGQEEHLGYFATAELAHEAYCKRAVELFGEFARFG
jgi:hypothetical protein